MHNSQLGWSQYHEDRYTQLAAGPDREAGHFCARVIRVHRQLCTVLSEQGEFTARIPGKLFHDAATRSELPAVGDWVIVQLAADNTVVVRKVLERRTVI